jgi:DNA-binding IclR family transcriptional regulator
MSTKNTISISGKNKIDTALTVLKTLNKEMIKTLTLYFTESGSATLDELVEHTGWTHEKVKRLLNQLLKIKVIYLKDKFYLDYGRMEEIFRIARLLGNYPKSIPE